MTRNSLRHAAQQPALESRSASRRQNNEFHLLIFRELKNRFRGRPFQSGHRPPFLIFRNDALQVLLDIRLLLLMKCLLVYESASRGW